MKSRRTYKTNMYYFVLNSMLRDYASKERCSKRVKKQFDFVRNFIDSKDYKELKKFTEDAENGKNI